MLRKLLVAQELEHLPDFRRTAADHFDVTFAHVSATELASILGNYDYLIPSIKYKLSQTILNRGKRLRAISTPSTGTDHIDLEACAGLGIQVFSLKDDLELLNNITATAELAFGLMISVVRSIPPAYQDVLEGNWNSSSFRGLELQHKTLGIIGYGRLGAMLAGYARAFKMNIVATDPCKKINDSHVRQVSLDELLMVSDIVSVHVHLNDRTRGMIGREQLAKMKPGALIINTSRGAIIKTNDLIEALETGAIAGVGLDVLDGELDGDLGSHPLVKYARKHQNVVITPHIGGVTTDSQNRAYHYTLKKLIDLDGVIRPEPDSKQISELKKLKPVSVRLLGPIEGEV